MKHNATRLAALLLTAALLLSLTACGAAFGTGGPGPILVDENGLATWESVDGAVYYIYTIVDADYANLGEQTTTETQIQLPEGRCVHVRAVFPDGSMSGWMTSDYYGVPTTWDESDTGGSFRHDVAITLDDDGYATWESVEGAVYYVYTFVDGDNINDGERYTPYTHCQVPEGRCVHVRAVFPDGSMSEWMTSDYYGSKQYADPDYTRDLYSSYFDIRKSESLTYDLIANIDFSTVRTDDQGNVTFTAAGPKGEPMRFAGKGITVTEGAITFMPDSELFALDAIGRILAYIPEVSDLGPDGTSVDFSGGYTFNGQTSVDSVDELFRVWPLNDLTVYLMDPTYEHVPMVEYQPNMIGIGAPARNTDSFTISELTVRYDESTYAAELSRLMLNYEFYGSYLEGDLYDPTREHYDSENFDFTFYLMLLPELLDEVDPPTADYLNDILAYLPRAVIDLPMDRYEIGQLKDPDGHIMDKTADPLVPGCTLEIIIGGQTYDMPLPILSRAKGAQTLHELTPYANIPSQGETTVLVVPLQWSDYADPDPDGTLDMLRQTLGRVVDADGTVTDYSVDPFSLSAYYDAASYGDHHIESFLADWITMPYTLEEAQNIDPLNHSLPDEIFARVLGLYPDLDPSRFDRNGDGIVDSVIYITAAPESDTVNMAGMLGGAQHHRGYDASRAGTPEEPNLKDFSSISLPVLRSGGNTMVHEYAHFFGLIDYYDVTYSGIDAVGRFDMQSNGYGDWNAYSKYSVGWIEPEVVTGLEPGQSVEITIGSMTETGDAIVIPAAGTEFDGPFGEYMLVDLFTATGLNESDAADFGLGGAVGVRIYHVNAHMESRTLTDIYGDEANIGTVNVVNAYNDSGKYHIELLQRGGINTFTVLDAPRTQLAPQDLFRPGDRFDAVDYGQFLNGGRMDDGSEFGYTIEIVSIQGSGADSTATVRITRK